MKTIILTLALVTLSWSQVIYLPATLPTKIYFDTTGNHNQKRVNIIEKTIIERYDEYKIQCYNDSTAQVVGRGNVVCYPTYPPQYKYDYYETIYIHVEPTFNGFIEYLRRKQ